MGMGVCGLWALCWLAWLGWLGGAAGAECEKGSWGDPSRWLVQEGCSSHALFGGGGGWAGPETECRTEELPGAWNALPRRVRLTGDLARAAQLNAQGLLADQAEEDPRQPGHANTDHSEVGPAGAAALLERVLEGLGKEELTAADEADRRALPYGYIPGIARNFSGQTQRALQPCEEKAEWAERRLGCRAPGDRMQWYRGPAHRILPARYFSSAQYAFTSDCLKKLEEWQKPAKAESEEAQNAAAPADKDGDDKRDPRDEATCWKEVKRSELGEQESWVECERWDRVPLDIREQFGASAENFGRVYGSADLSVHAAQCRNPDNSSAGPWCFGEDKRLRFRAKNIDIFTQVIRGPCLFECRSAELSRPAVAAEGWPWAARCDGAEPQSFAPCRKEAEPEKVAGEEDKGRVLLGEILESPPALEGKRPVVLERFGFRWLPRPWDHRCFQTGVRSRAGLGPWAFAERAGAEGRVRHDDCSQPAARCLWAPCLHRHLDNHLTCLPRQLKGPHLQKRGGLADAYMFSDESKKVERRDLRMLYAGPRDKAVDNRTCLYWSDVLALPNFSQRRFTKFLKMLISPEFTSADGTKSFANEFGAAGPELLRSRHCLDPVRHLSDAGGQQELWRVLYAPTGGDVGRPGEVDRGPWCFVETLDGPRPKPCFLDCEAELVDVMECLPAKVTGVWQPYPKVSRPSGTAPWAANSIDRDTNEEPGEGEQTVTIRNAYPYYGRRERDSEGRGCLGWRTHQSLLPRASDRAKSRVAFEPSLMEENFCRNAPRGVLEKSVQGPWCLTSQGPKACFGDCDALDREEKELTKALDKEAQKDPDATPLWYSRLDPRTEIFNVTLPGELRHFLPAGTPPLYPRKPLSRAQLIQRFLRLDGNQVSSAMEQFGKEQGGTVAEGKAAWAWLSPLLRALCDEEANLGACVRYLDPRQGRVRRLKLRQQMWEQKQAEQNGRRLRRQAGQEGAGDEGLAEEEDEAKPWVRVKRSAGEPAPLFLSASGDFVEGWRGERRDEFAAAQTPPHVLAAQAAEFVEPAGEAGDSGRARKARRLAVPDLGRMAANQTFAIEEPTRAARWLGLVLGGCVMGWVVLGQGWAGAAAFRVWWRESRAHAAAWRLQRQAIHRYQKERKAQLAERKLRKERLAERKQLRALRKAHKAALQQGAVGSGPAPSPHAGPANPGPDPNPYTVPNPNAGPANTGPNPNPQINLDDPNLKVPWPTL